MKTAILAVGAALFALATATPALADGHGSDAPTLTAPEIEFTEWTLDNGLRVIAIQDDTTATVTTSLWYEIGSKLDPEGRSGFAHLFEHILSRKTLNMPYNMIYGLTADVGGTRNASNGTDRTNYYEQVPAEYLEAMLWTHRERMAFPVVDDEVFDRERNVVKEELRQRVLAPPYGRFSRFVLPENAYDVLPHRRPGIGSIEELDSATIDDARAFHQAYYGPDTATLIVAGNFEMGNLRGLVDQYFADIPRRANPVDVTITTREPERTAPRSVKSYAPNVPLPLVGALWKGPEALHPDMPALEVMDAILGRGNNSRLHKALVLSGKAVQSAQFVNATEEGGYIAQFGVINPTANMEEVAAILKAEREKIRTQPVTEAELTEAKNELIASSLRRRETARGRAFALGEALVSTGNPKAADLRLEAIANVTAQDVMRVAAKWLDPNKRTDLTYERGEDDPSAYANPAPFPTFRTLPPATGEPLAVRPEGEREPVPGPGASPDVVAPTLGEATLANGIKVVAAQTGNVPIATMTVLVPGGSKSDPRAKAGIAQLAASLANQGTGTMSAEDIAARLESLGASFGATAGSDGTFMSLTAPVANMEAAGRVLAEIIRDAAYPEEAFQRERKRAIDGLQVSMKEPGSLASQVLRATMYGDAPYGTLPNGTPETLGTITREDLAAHRTQWWHPGATQIIVSGGIAPDESIALARSLFEGWTVAGDAPAPVANPAGAAQPPRTLVVDMPDAGQAAVYVAARAISRKDDEYYPLILANSVLGGGSSGRLFEEVRTKRSLSYGAYSSLPSRADDSYLFASSQTKNDTADEVAAVILGEFERLGKEPLDETLLAKRRLYLSGSYARALETSGGFNSIVAGLLQQGIDADEAAQYAAKLSGVSAEAASAAAAKYADPENTTLVIVGDAKQFIDDLKELRSDVQVVKAEQLNLLDVDEPILPSVEPTSPAPAED
ncbi:M16 family metallopeptidase [Parerythrobacter jejuensis]|uniref:Insulinase family protein n=1 Tax=Parerythrobacter jejuensis TaxID=795812 RepID=A0A845AP53_9SPHN|nr:pitrilysin family protein [Parerythrobacter jejuensis]MXP31384.1 insulinase family protein [Parerythrobacter jejuensis]MXP34144.1 insulinase family protein [Parerythrobacter jejuensis]